MGRCIPSRRRAMCRSDWLLVGVLLVGAVGVGVYRCIPSDDVPLRVGMTEEEVYATLHDELHLARTNWGLGGADPWEFYLGLPDPKYGEERTVSIYYDTNGRLAR